MNQRVSLPRALCLPIPDIEALIQGRSIAALPRMFIHRGQTFALYPAEFPFLIKAWARCEICQILDNTQQLEILSKLTIWTPETLKEKLRQEQNIFVAYLRVYHLPPFCQISVNPDIKEKVGKFIGLSNITASEAKPVLSDRIFAQRQRQLQNLEPPEHPELEELQSALSQIASKYPAAQQLDNEIKIFLGWSDDSLTQSINTDLEWINKIASLGNRTIERDRRNNFQAGTNFENIVHKSLGFLGFTVDKEHKGGAGGLDLYCSQPYPLVCECKAGQMIPHRTVEQLDRIGKRHLKENYLQAVRLIIGPGQPSRNLQESAQISKVSIINPMTLQKLVELKAKYPGAINLIELQKYLEPGQIDGKIDEYIDKIEKQIQLRSHIIQLVKNYLQNAGKESTGVETLHGAYIQSNQPQPLETHEMHEILIELSSPLTGYLGREKGKYWKSDRFYFLRDLPTTPK
ncbi:MAG TPA: DUF1802 family protein [Nodularia sp. (in: cyanobacteria)]|nr:DUF1802 family protein [Nodularia sp. (in: cyanobacteria)]